MDLAVLCDLASLPVEDIGRIIDISVFVGFWDGPGGQIDLVPLSQPGKGLPGGAAAGLRVDGEIWCFIGAGKHLRQADHVCAGILCLAEQTVKERKVGFFLGIHPGLELGNSQKFHGYSSV